MIGNSDTEGFMSSIISNVDEAGIFKMARKLTANGSGSSTAWSSEKITAGMVPGMGVY